MARLEEYLPPLEEALVLNVEELGLYLLRFLRAFEAEGNRFNLRNLLTPQDLRYFAGMEWEFALSRRLTEAWAWLESEAFVAQIAESDWGWQYVTERGRAVLDQSLDPSSFAAGKYLPANTLHPKLVGPCRSAYVRGDFDTAVFEAFKAVEIAVREKGAFAPEDVGENLMRKAFKLNPPGPLTYVGLPDGEQEGMGHLFAGGMQVFRNASGHREMGLSDPVEIAGIIRFADVLLRLVDRAPGAAPNPQ